MTSKVSSEEDAPANLPDADSYSALLIVPEDVHRRGLAPPEGRQIWHTDSDGRRHGTALRWYANGQLRALTDYVHGRRQGRYRSWHPGGQLEVSGDFDGDREEGAWRRYAEDDSLQVEISLTAGLSEGRCRSFYPGGVLAREWFARQGREEGSATVYLPDGTVFSTEEYRAGQRHGPRRIWINGVLTQEEQWADGVCEHAKGLLIRKWPRRQLRQTKQFRRRWASRCR